MPNKWEYLLKRQWIEVVWLSYSQQRDEVSVLLKEDKKFVLSNSTVSTLTLPD